MSQDRYGGGQDPRVEDVSEGDLDTDITLPEDSGYVNQSLIANLKESKTTAERVWANEDDLGPFGEPYLVDPEEPTGPKIEKSDEAFNMTVEMALADFEEKKTCL